MLYESFQPWWILVAFFATALLAPFLSGARGRVPAAVWALIPAVGFIYFLAGSAPIWKGEVWRASLPWAPGIGLNWGMSGSLRWDCCWPSS